MNQKMCFPLCTLNHESPVYNEYLTGPTAFIVQFKIIHVFPSLPSFFFSFLSLSILPAFTSRISQYLALEYNQIYVVPIMPASDASYYIFQPAFSCLCLCMEQVPHKDNALSSIKFLLGTSSFHDEYLNKQ